jgi:hypothetical protein
MTGIRVASYSRGGMAVAKRSNKRELIDTRKAKMFGRRDEQGRFKEMDAVGSSLAADRRRRAKTASKPGQGDRGDRKR